jgi:hypothetical protein
MRNTKYSGGTMLMACCALSWLLPFVRIAASEMRLNVRAALPSQASVASPHYHFIAGRQFIYQVNYSGTALTDFRALLEDKNQSVDKSQPDPSGLAQSFKTTVKGQLLVTVVNVKDHNVVLAYSLRNADVRLIANGQEDGTDAEMIKTDLSRNIFAVLDRRGKVLSVRFDPAMSKLSQGFARGLISFTQFVFPSEGLDKVNQWEAQEEDLNGQYVARYERVNHRPVKTNGSVRSLITFKKQITRYLPAVTKPSPTEFNIEPAITPGGSLMVTFDQRNGRVSALDGTESQTIELAGKTVVHAQSKVRLNYLGGEVLGSGKLAALRAASSQRERSVAATPLSASVSKEESEASIERTELATDNLEKLLADLAKLESASDDKNETPIYLKFKALIYLHPESSAPLGQVLATADAKSLTMRVLTGALGVVSNPEAQAALVGAIKARSTDWPALSMLIPALNEASAPTPLAEETVRELASESPNHDIASTAQLTLGAMAHNLAETSPERATRIVDSLIKQIDASSSADTTRLLLLALGNAGSPHAYSTIARFTNDSSPDLRAAAASALRWVDSDQADAQLIKVLSSDPESVVRLEAATAIGFRQINANAFEAQKQALATDKDEKVRLALLRNLWKGRVVFPEARELIEKAATSDASEDVRKAATELLATHQTQLN